MKEVNADNLAVAIFLIGVCMLICAVGIKAGWVYALAACGLFFVLLGIGGLKK